MQNQLTPRFGKFVTQFALCNYESVRFYASKIRNKKHKCKIFCKYFTDLRTRASVTRARIVFVSSAYRVQVTRYAAIIHPRIED